MNSNQFLAFSCAYKLTNIFHMPDCNLTSICAFHSEISANKSDRGRRIIMDFMDVLFNPDKPFTPIVIAGGTTNGRVVSSDRPAYAERHLQTDALADEIEDIRQQYDNSIKTQKPSNEPGHALEDTEKFYSNFKFDRRSQSALQLPVYASKDNILQKIADFPSLVIEGSTGCGKTTQVTAQYVIHIIFLSSFVAFSWPFTARVHCEFHQFRYELRWGVAFDAKIGEIAWF